MRRCLREARNRLQARQLDPLALAAQQQVAAWAAVQADGQDASVAPSTNVAFPLLSAVLDVALALDRNQEAAQVRGAHTDFLLLLPLQKGNMLATCSDSWEGSGAPVDLWDMQGWQPSA